jgi:hypothetical protein
MIGASAPDLHNACCRDRASWENATVPVVWTASGEEKERTAWRQPVDLGDKLTRFGPFSSQCRAGNMKILRTVWNEELFTLLWHNVPPRRNKTCGFVG